MRKKKLDRRVQYTLSALKEAMIELLQERHLTKISVVALCELADVNRSTFYTHFKDQYDLLQYITAETLDDIQLYLQALNRDSNMTVSVDALKQILDYVKENADVFRALLGDNGDPDLQRKIIRMIELVSPKDYEEYDEQTKNYLMLFQINGCISILHKWLQSGTPESSRDMSILILKAIGKIK